MKKKDTEDNSLTIEMITGQRVTPSHLRKEIMEKLGLGNEMRIHTLVSYKGILLHDDIELELKSEDPFYLYFYPAELSLDIILDGLARNDSLDAAMIHTRLLVLAAVFSEQNSALQQALPRFYTYIERNLDLTLESEAKKKIALYTACRLMEIPLHSIKNEDSIHSTADNGLQDFKTSFSQLLEEHILEAGKASESTIERILRIEKFLNRIGSFTSESTKDDNYRSTKFQWAAERKECRFLLLSVLVAIYLFMCVILWFLTLGNLSFLAETATFSLKNPRNIMAMAMSAMCVVIAILRRVRKSESLRSALTQGQLSVLRGYHGSPFQADNTSKHDHTSQDDRTLELRNADAMDLGADFKFQYPRMGIIVLLFLAFFMIFVPPIIIHQYFAEYTTNCTDITFLNGTTFEQCTYYYVPHTNWLASFLTAIPMSLLAYILSELVLFYYGVHKITLKILRKAKENQYLPQFNLFNPTKPSSLRTLLLYMRVHVDRTKYDFRVWCTIGPILIIAFMIAIIAFISYWSYHVWAQILVILCVYYIIFFAIYLVIILFQIIVINKVRSDDLIKYLCECSQLMFDQTLTLRRLPISHPEERCEREMLQQNRKYLLAKINYLNQTVEYDLIKVFGIVHVDAKLLAGVLITAIGTIVSSLFAYAREQAE